MYVEMEEYLQTWRAMEEDKETTSSSKRRKFYSELKNEVHGGGGEEAESATTENSASPATSGTNSRGSDEREEFSSDVVVTKASSDLENDDNLQPESSGTAISSSTDRVFSREATPTNFELYGDSERVPVRPVYTSKKKRSSSTHPAISRRIIAENAPSAADLDEFFAAAEKCNQKGFAEKYNYDFVKDVPLEGKYQWFRLLP